MKKTILLTAALLIFTITMVGIRNTVQQKIVVMYPAVNQVVKTKFNLKGQISSTLLQESVFALEIISGDGRIVLEEVLQVSTPSFGTYISIPVQFNENIDITGITEETEICHGKSTVRVMSLKKDISTSIPVICGGKL